MRCTRQTRVRVVRIKSRGADKGTGRPVSLFSCAALLFEVFLFLALIAGRLFFRTYIAIPSFLHLVWSDNTQWRRLFLLLLDSLFFIQCCFLSVGVLYYSEFVSLSSYHFISRALLVYVVFVSSELHPFFSYRHTIRVSLSIELLLYVDAESANLSKGGTYRR